ncbi:MAG: hypothetical protein ACRD0C_14840 [Acidimicrobiia bacterium]
MRNPVRRPPLALALLLAAAALVGVARPAGACTCAPFDTRSALTAADAAFVGTFVSRTDPPSPLDGAPAGAGDAVYRFRVDQAVKGALGPEVEVHSASNEASCGLSVAAGRPVGLLLSERDGHYHGDLCRQPSPERLLRASEPLATPEGRLPPWVVVGSTYGNGRSVAIDDEGRVAGVGTGAGATTAVAVCPDRQRAVELFTVRGDDGPDSHGITVRRLDTMAAESERLLPELRPSEAQDSFVSIQPEALACRDAAATDVLVFARSSSATGDRGRILQVVPGADPVTLWEGPAPRSAAFGPDGATAYLNLGPQGEEVVALALDGPAEARSIVRVPAGSGPMVASADGRRLATVAVGASRVSQAVTVDLGTTPPTVATADLGAAGVTGDVQWTGDRLVFMPASRPAEAVRVYDPGLTVLASWAGWTAEHSVVVGSHLYGASQGAVRSAPLTTGPATVVRELEDALVVAVVDVSPPPAVESATETPVPTTTSTAPAPTTTTTTAPRKPAVTTTTVALPTTTTTAPMPERRSEEPPQAAGKAATKGDGGGTGGAVWLGLGAALILAGGGVGWWRIRRGVGGQPE